MTRAMGGNATLAANIIAITTVGSFFTTALGIYFCAHGARFNLESLWKRTVRNAVRP